MTEPKDATKNPMLIKLLLTGLLIALTGPIAAEDDERAPATPRELADSSEIIVLAQLDRTNYEMRRGFPVSGKGWARVLIRYKVPRPIDRVRIVEEGFGDDRCYFPDTPMWQELPRYLLFLNRDEDGNHIGNRAGCMFEVLVTRDNRYAVRWPQDGLALEEGDEALVQTLDFHGPGSTMDVREMTSIRREQMREDYFLEPIEGEDGLMRYTRGIPLDDFRDLMGADNLTRERRQGRR